MEDTLMIVIAIGTAVVLIVVVPFMSMADRTSDVVQLTLDTALTEFMDSSSTKGKITLDDYEKLIEQISATGTAYTVTLELQVIDENAGKKVSQAESFKIGENTYVAYYNPQILDTLYEDGEIPLTEGSILAGGIAKEGKELSDILHEVVLGQSDNSSFITWHTRLISTTGNS